MKPPRYANSPGGSIRRRSLRLECLAWRGRWRLVPVCLLTLFLPAGVFAMMAPKVYQQARDTAMYHVQVKVRNVTPGNCAVTGEVVQIFRDQTGTLTKGAALTFYVSCRRAGDPVIVGGALWTDYDSLMKAKYLEVFLNSDENGYQVALWQSRIIEAATAQPTFRSSAGTP